MARQPKATSSRWRARSRSIRRAPIHGLLVAVLAAVVTLLLPTPGARADGLADEAELHFQLGADAYQSGEYSGALEHFLASNRLVPNKNVVFNIARTFERMARFADAHRYYVDALHGEKDANIAGELEAALRRISPRVAVLTVETTPPGATIYLDRKDLGSRGTSPRPLAALGLRGTLEAPRRIGYDSDAQTEAAFIVDTTLSGFASRYGLHYVVGVYNVFDWTFELPVADTFASRTIRQNGRTFMLDISTPTLDPRRARDRVNKRAG